MTPSEIKSALAKLGGGANKTLGQHFLVDEHALDSMVTTADIQTGDTVLEIGPGLGVLTRALVEQGAEALALEQDRRFIPALESVAHVVHGNAVDLDWDALVGATRPWKFVSNLPYGITSFALRKALYETRPPSKLVVLIQREVAERCVEVAPRGKTSLLSLMIALSCSSARIVRRVSRGAFFPPPKVESAILELVPMTRQEREARFGIAPEKIMSLAKQGFAHPRKQLASNLGGETQIKTFLKELTGTEKVRAEDLSPEQWASLAKHQ